MFDAINTVGGTKVMVTDQQKALEFYTQKLGFAEKKNLVEGKYKWIEVCSPNSDIAISLVDPNSFDIPDKREDAKKKIGTSTGIWFYTKDIQASYEILKSKGVEITPPEKQSWGEIMSRFSDQDKNEYELFEILRDN